MLHQQLLLNFPVLLIKIHCFVNRHHSNNQIAFNYFCFILALVDGAVNAHFRTLYNNINNNIKKHNNNQLK